MKINHFSLLLLVLATQLCHAQIVLQCDTRNHKQIQLLDLDDTLHYQFGKKSHPELVINLLKNQIRYNPWGGAGSSEYYSIELPNHDFTYHLYSSRNRNTPQHDVTAGVVVEKYNQSIAEFDCIENSHYINRIEDAVLSHLYP